MSYTLTFVQVLIKQTNTTYESHTKHDHLFVRSVHFVEL